MHLRGRIRVQRCVFSAEYQAKGKTMRGGLPPTARVSPLISGISLQGGELGEGQRSCPQEPVLTRPSFLWRLPSPASFPRAGWAAGASVACFVPVSSGQGPRLPVRAEKPHFPGTGPEPHPICGGPAWPHLIFIGPLPDYHPTAHVRIIPFPRQEN